MRKTVFGFSLSVLLFALCFSAEAQQPKKVPRIGYLSISPGGPRQEAFRQGLRELGYMEGKNIIIEWRSAGGKRERGRALADELVRLKVDVIVTGGPGATRPAKEATSTIPIVMTQDNDPIDNGFIASLAQPGGNITGLSNLAAELSGKRLELLKEVVPRLTRVTIFGNTAAQSYAESLKEAQLAAGALKLRLQYLDVLGLKDIEPAFRAAEKGRAEALLMLLGGPILNTHGRKIIDLTAKSRLPAIYERPNDVEAGGLMSYSANTGSPLG
jgi:putative tryptophan/tyrosine transport system substrate-binding protein